jgi:hypothetical protein
LPLRAIVAMSASSNSLRRACAQQPEAVSQFGVVIEYFTLPKVALSAYVNDDGENGPPCVPEAL